LTQLLRKKVEPEVEELMARGRETAQSVTREDAAELQDMWKELREWTHERIARYVQEEAGDPYTKEERERGVENVRTGLKRDLEDERDDGDDDDDDDADEDEDEDMEGGEGKGGGGEQDGEAEDQRGPELETLLWFTTRGDFDVPPNVEYDRKVVLIKKGLEGVRIPPDTMPGSGAGPSSGPS
jgi:mediator of RNA polymerase II transcription subunit 8